MRLVAPYQGDFWCSFSPLAAPQPKLKRRRGDCHPDQIQWRFRNSASWLVGSLSSPSRHVLRPRVVRQAGKSHSLGEAHPKSRRLYSCNLIRISWGNVSDIDHKLKTVTQLLQQKTKASTEISRHNKRWSFLALRAAGVARPLHPSESFQPRQSARVDHDWGSRAPTFTPGDEVSYFGESAFVVSDGDLSKLNSPGARMRRTASAGRCRTGTSTPIARR